MSGQPDRSVLALQATSLGCLVQAARAYFDLPATVASHFNAAGFPDGWAPKGGFLGLYAGMVVLLWISLSGAVRSIQRAPNDRLNLPNKDYWLAPERRDKTLATVASYLRVFGAATNLLLMDVFAQALAVNLRHAARLGHPMISLTAYIAFTIVWIAALVRGFRSKPGQGSQNS
ncbi:MAG: DUF1648 domain-containing protein [Elusimicrobiota bacterium]